MTDIEAMRAAEAKVEQAIDDFADAVATPIAAEITRLREDLDRVTRERDEARRLLKIEGEAHNLTLNERDKAQAALAKRDEEVARLRAALTDARADMQAWQSYASPYMRDKHDAEGDLAKITAALKEPPHG